MKPLACACGDFVSVACYDVGQGLAHDTVAGYEDMYVFYGTFPEELVVDMQDCRIRINRGYDYRYIAFRRTLRGCPYRYAVPAQGCEHPACGPALAQHIIAHKAYD